MKINLNKNKGITLIALIITIIVLLILAGITLTMLVDPDTGTQKAVNAKKENDRGDARDIASILVLETVQNYYNDKYEKRESNAKDPLEYIASKLKDGEATGEYVVTVVEDGTITITRGTEVIETGKVSEKGDISWDE